MALTRAAIACGSLTVPSSYLLSEAGSSTHKYPLTRIAGSPSVITLYVRFLKLSTLQNGKALILSAMPVHRGDASDSAEKGSTNTAATASLEQESKVRGRPPKKSAGDASAVGRQSDAGSSTIPMEKKAETRQVLNGLHQDNGEVESIGKEEKPRGAHLFQYPEGPSEASLLVYDSGSGVSDAVANRVALLSKEGIRTRGCFTIVLSGGSLVKALALLAEKPHVSNIGWDRWHVFWVDERMVPLSHADSNYRLAKEEFLSKVPVPQDQIHTLDDWDVTSAAAQAYELTLRDLVKKKVLPATTVGWRKYPRFDLILLGIGPDGHIASLFPNSAHLAETKRWVVPITKSPKPPSRRISLTLPCINCAANVLFVVLGASKAEILQRVFERPALPGALPAQLVRPFDGQLTWLVDNEAASHLSIEQWNDPKKFPFCNWKQSRANVGSH